MVYVFDDYSLDPVRRELRRGTALIALEPQVFDFLQYLISERERVVSKDDVIAAVWGGRIVSDSTLSSRITAVRHAIGDCGKTQRLIRTIPRKGLRFVGDVREVQGARDTTPAIAASPLSEATAGQIWAPPGDSQRRQLTVMVCDLLGSVALSRHLDPEDLREIATSSRPSIKDAVERFGGFLAKSAIDGHLAYFGYPQAHEDDAERAVRAGFEVIRAAAQLKVDGVAMPLRPRIGIATSMVVVSEVSDRDAPSEFMIVGEAPLLASRLLMLADPGSVVISASTRQLIGGLFDNARFGAIELKGVTEPIEAFRVLRENTIASRFEALRSAQSKLVGRGEELTFLRRCWRDAREATGRVVSVIGEAGIGKSRLTRALQEELAAEPLMPVFHYCSPYHRGSALYPITRPLLRAAGIEQEDRGEEKLEKLEAWLAQSSRDLREHVSLFAALLSIPGGDRYPAPRLTPRRLKERTLGALLSQLKRLAAAGPILLVFEDLQWSDPTTLEFLSLVVEEAPSLPLLMLATFRPEFTPSWPNHRHVSTLSLSRLDRSEGRALVRDVAEEKPIAGEIVEQIVTRSDGMPLFIEELTKTVLESGLLRDAGDRYEIAEAPSQVAIPATLHASLLARFDRLGSAKEVAQIGATIGREFTYQLIAAIAGVSEAALRTALEHLIDAGLVFQHGLPPDARYYFKHALVQDAAYGTLLRSTRRQLHHRVAQAIAELTPELVETQPELLAHHYAEAGLIDDAIAYAIKAGRRAAARSPNEEAVTHYTKALELLRTKPPGAERDQQELELMIALGVATIAGKGVMAEDAEIVYRRARELCDKVPDSPHRFTVLRGLWNCVYARKSLIQAQELSNELVAVADAEGDEARRALARRAQGCTLFLRGKIELASEMFREAIELWDPDKAAAQILVYGEDASVFCRVYSGTSLWCLGFPEQSSAAIRKGVADAKRLSHPFNLAVAHICAALAHNLRKDFSEAMGAAEAGLALAIEHGLRYIVGIARLNKGYARVALDQIDSSIAEMEEGWADWYAVGAKASTTECAIWLADACKRAGRVNAARKWLNVAAEHAFLFDERYVESEIHRVHGELLLEQGATKEAETCLHRSIDVARGQKAKSLELRTAMVLAHCWHQMGKRQAALELLSPIYGWFTEGFDTPDLRAANSLLDQITRR